jgi:hypothetical protein
MFPLGSPKGTSNTQHQTKIKIFPLDESTAESEVARQASQQEGEVR